MKSVKGGITSETIIAGATFMLLFVIFAFWMSGGGVQEKEISQSIDLRLSELRKHSVVSNTLNDKMWRANTINKGEYEELPAYKVISYYFSTPGNKMHFYQKQKTKSTVKKDITNYLQYKMDEYWKQGSTNINYFVDIRNPSRTPRKPQNITVKTYTPTGKQPRVVTPLSITNGEKIYLTFFTNKSQKTFSQGNNQ